MSKLLETVTFIKPPARRGMQPALVEHWLEHDAKHWKSELLHCTQERGMHCRDQRLRWSGKETAKIPQTDLVTYIMQEIDPSVATEMSTLLMEGRVHVILLLSQEKIPRVEWCQNLTILPIREMWSEGNILMTKQQHPGLMVFFGC